MLYKFCIAKHDPRNPCQRLSVEELELNNTVIKTRANKGESNKNARKLLTGYGRKLSSNV